ncbi:S8 family serine peptidase [Bernardetia sp.]|uniref:S8 family serine peptidase n=1 Tax=Bernardetia sp. TaxID=1937974 RepID=UPI0025B8414A|nr:S8 family serine peptidase [Bernardetia sp.]
MKSKQLLFTVIITFFCTGLFSKTLAQTSERLVYFTDKNGTAFSTSRPLEFLTQRAVDRREKQGIEITEQDLPVNAEYVAELKNLGAVVPYTIKWFNAAIVVADEATFTEISNLSFVEKIDRIVYNENSNQITRISATCDIENPNEEDCQEIYVADLKEIEENEENFNYGNSLAQIQMLGADKMHEQGYLGQGVHIAVLDGGFTNANTLSAFTHADISFVYDVVGNGQNVYQGSSHGTKVLSAMLSKIEGQLIGTAPEATYHLFRTENASSSYEKPIEEAFWAVGAEKADSLGVDIIQSSLGYYDFENPSYNYTHEDLDGKTALISRAAQIASEKGIVVVTSAGNSGNDSWGKISFPADAEGVLAVGAVDVNGEIANFSSRGNTADGRIKPDVMAMGSGTVLWNEQDRLITGSGTSYAAPLVAGLIAGFMQQNPDLTAQEIMTIVRRAGDSYFDANSEYGYGIPTFKRLNDIILSNEGLTNENSQVRIFPNPVKSSLKIEIDENLFTTNQELHLAIYNLQGKIILQDVLTSSKSEIEFPTVPKGMYIIHIEGQNYQGTIKMLKD